MAWYSRTISGMPRLLTDCSPVQPRQPIAGDCVVQRERGTSKRRQGSHGVVPSAGYCPRVRFRCTLPHPAPSAPAPSLGGPLPCPALAAAPEW
jgi:hypothetical protein